MCDDCKAGLTLPLSDEMVGALVCIFESVDAGLIKNSEGSALAVEMYFIDCGIDLDEEGLKQLIAHPKIKKYSERCAVNIKSLQDRENARLNDQIAALRKIVDDIDVAEATTTAQKEESD